MSTSRIPRRTHSALTRGPTRHCACSGPRTAGRSRAVPSSSSISTSVHAPVWCPPQGRPGASSRRSTAEGSEAAPSPEGAMRPTRLIASIPLLVLAVAAPTGHAQYISAYPSCAPNDSIYVVWSTYFPTPDSTSYPDWVGYDVMRRSSTDCGEYVRVNDEIIPRSFETATHYFQELNPSPGKVLEYVVRHVDANHQQVFIPGSCSPCNGYVTCPSLAAPITIGTLTEMFFIYVMPCPGTCYPFPFLDEQPSAELAPYVGTNTVFGVFGTIGCGSLEGCSIGVDHWEFATCVTPTKTSSWGRLKTIYR